MGIKINELHNGSKTSSSRDYKLSLSKKRDDLTPTVMSNEKFRMAPVAQYKVYGGDMMEASFSDPFPK